MCGILRPVEPGGRLEGGLEDREGRRDLAMGISEEQNNAIQSTSVWLSANC
jgi:hypothetical protein